METIELTWVRPTQRTAVQCSVHVDTPEEASALFDKVLDLLGGIAWAERALVARNAHAP